MTSRPVCLATRRTLAGEDLGPDALGRARAHATSCPECSGLLGDEEPERNVHRTSSRTLLLRGLVLAVAAVQLALALPWLFGHNLVLGGHAAPEHLTRDGAFGVIASVAGAITAVRARASVPMLWVCVALSALQMVTGAVDDAGHHVNLHFESAHAVLLVLASLVAVLVVMQRPPAVSTRRRPQLRSVAGPVTRGHGSDSVKR